MGGYDRVSLKMDRRAGRMNSRFINSNHVGRSTWPKGENEYFEVKTIEPLKQHDFNGRNFNIPGNYDAYLKCFFGDYMTLPSPEERRDHHISVYKKG